VPGKKRQHAITAADALRVFDDACIEELAKIGRLPAGADRHRFADGIREAARIYAQDAHRLDATAVRKEIENLQRAAVRREYERVAELLGALSHQALRKLTGRRMQVPVLPAPIPSRRAPDSETIGKPPRHVLRSVEEYAELDIVELKLPSAQELLDPARREEACDVVRRFCSIGGLHIKGRMRPTGRRSKTWKSLLCADLFEPGPEPLLAGSAYEPTYVPVPRPAGRPPKREAERQFVMNLQLAWLEASGKPPPLTANPQRLGPFARMVRECLKLAGAGYDEADKHPKSADFAVADLINEVNKRRRTTLGIPTDEERQLLRWEDDGGRAVVFFDAIEGVSSTKT
jgi:hypothetical protein